MSSKQLLPIGLGIIILAFLSVWLTFVIAESYQIQSGTQSWSMLNIMAPIAHLNTKIEKFLFGFNINHYDDDIASQVIYRDRKPDVVQVSNSCTEWECLTQKTSGDLYGTGNLRGYYAAVDRRKSSTGETVSCDGFVVINGADNFMKYFDAQFVRQNPFVTKTNQGQYIINLPIDTMSETEKKLFSESAAEKPLDLIVLKIEKSLVGADGCFSPFIALRTAEALLPNGTSKERIYPVTDGKTYRILSGVTLECEGSDEPQHDEILEIMVNGKWKEVYRPAPRTDGRCFGNLSISEQDIQVSPKRDYVMFTLVGWEWYEQVLVNTKTKKQILPEDTHIVELLWSNSGANYAYVSQSEQFSGSGEDAVFVSTFNRPDIPKNVFSLSKWAGSELAWSNYELKNLKFLNEYTIQFSVFGLENSEPTEEELVRYTFDLKEEKLIETFKK